MFSLHKDRGKTNRPEQEEQRRRHGDGPGPTGARSSDRRRRRAERSGASVASAKPSAGKGKRAMATRTPQEWGDKSGTARSMTAGERKARRGSNRKPDGAPCRVVVNRDARLEVLAGLCNTCSGVSTSFRYTLWVVASRLRNRNVRLRESCEWPPSRPTREFIAVAAFGRQLRESDALRSPTPRQSSNLGIRFLVDAFARPQHLVAT